MTSEYKNMKLSGRSRIGHEKMVIIGMCLKNMDLFSELILKTKNKFILIGFLNTDFNFEDQIQEFIVTRPSKAAWSYSLKKVFILAKKQRFTGDISQPGNPLLQHV